MGLISKAFLSCRYLYAFVWRNVGSVNDDFFGTFLALVNVVFTAYFSIFAMLTSDYRSTFLYRY